MINNINSITPLIETDARSTPSAAGSFKPEDVNTLNESVPDYPEGFLERVADQGKIVEWAPQEKVLAHPAIACFLTHCGWSSVTESLSRGVPFLCWPSFGDQFHNQSYINDVWKAGLQLDLDENGSRSRDEIKNKILLLLSDGNFKENALKLKKMAEQTIGPDGSSFKNFEKFIMFLKN
ncbi:glycosyltransferase [Lithospermum erythrorhizon]|uniref:Glycosyltransferase n=1 Tax=Lithospermum erythrorhizon TaxID=34254 RepID=A0AAV3RKN3_LITER